jgi:hypothetical protein
MTDLKYVMRIYNSVGIKLTKKKNSKQIENV